MNMARLVETIVRHEGQVRQGDRHMPYKDSVGKLTIGHGRNLSDRGISSGEARFMLVSDIQETINELRHRYRWFDPLDEIRQEVVINMAFNMGVPTFGMFVGTIAHIERGEYADAADHMLRSKWARQVGYRATELSGMMRYGRVEV